MFKLNGLGGFLILVLVLVAVWFGLVGAAVTTQKQNAVNYIQTIE